MCDNHNPIPEVKPKKNNLRITPEAFFNKCKQVHGDTYIYPAPFTKTTEKIEIICKIHGSFMQLANHHTSGRGCKKCGLGRTHDSKRNSVEEKIEKFKLKHGDRYDYSMFKEYSDCNEKVPIICREPNHGLFHQLSEAHAKGQGCPKCGDISSATKQAKTIEQFKREVEEKFSGNIIVLSNEYKNHKTSIKAHCVKHNEDFNIMANFLIRNSKGCPVCSRDAVTYSKEEFVSLANIKHDFKFKYPSEYYNSKTPIDVECEKHGIWQVMPYSHLQGHGCPRCYKSVSKAELEIFELIKSWGLEAINGDRKILDGKQIDILIPSKNIAIEYNGLFWHGESNPYKPKESSYHLNKTNLALSKNIRLIHIFESEWIHQRNIVIFKLKNLLGLSDAKKIGGRNCTIQKIDSKTSNEFLNSFHLQGGDKSPQRYGAFIGEENKLIGVMTFQRINSEWHLNRFAADFDYKVSGLASKMLAQFIKDAQPPKVVTFADRRWTVDGDNNMYVKMGFKNVGTTTPAYHYFKPHNPDYVLYNRQNFMKHKIIEKFPMIDKSLSEREMMFSLEYDRIYDCGNWKFEYIPRYL